MKNAKDFIKRHSFYVESVVVKKKYYVSPVQFFEGYTINLDKIDYISPIDYNEDSNHFCFFIKFNGDKIEFVYEGGECKDINEEYSKHFNKFVRDLASVYSSYCNGNSWKDFWSFQQWSTSFKNYTY